MKKTGKRYTEDEILKVLKEIEAEALSRLWLELTE